MSNDSTVAGFITPETTPVYDDALDDIFQAATAGILGLDGSLVRPRLQREPLPEPAASDDWVAVGVTSIDDDWLTYEDHQPAGDGGLGTDRMQSDEMIEVTFSIYGPNARLNSKVLRAGLQLGQNRESLTAQGIEFHEMAKPVVVPALIKNAYVPRIDTRVTFRRRAEFVYAIRNVLSASFEVVTDVGITPSTTQASN